MQQIIAEKTTLVGAPHQLKTEVGKKFTLPNPVYEEAVNRWRPLLKQHKAEIINLLSGKPGGTMAATLPLPHWCRKDCIGLETTHLPNEGEVPGCVHPATGAWRRLDLLTECPETSARRRPKEPAWPPVANWCKPGCDHFHLFDGEAWCCEEIGTRQWSRRRISGMRECEEPN